ncbi:helix-turn-helix transcriptional regulator [Shewanella sp. Scap07]|uniref:ArsR/SmtB family transcription factor n=1 Tax=Shewanella sp. Scap07 TaxID=2589987 RepID=UPI002118754D|nr:winged helix-turn-helix domain-containing protein [Shewanella sp. Scap07]
MSKQNNLSVVSESYSQEIDMAALAAAMSDSSRMKILCALMDGRAWTATELSAVAGISASTTSSHLSRLVKANLLMCLSQGRHRYFRLYNNSIASLLESMMGVTFQTSNPSRSRVPEELLKARTCYDHLAGDIAVKLYDSLVSNGWLESDGSDLTLQGKEEFLKLGVCIEAKTKRKKCCPCLDWSERKFHLGGFLGASLLEFLEMHSWIERVSGYREVIITPKGHQELSRHFQINK